MSKIGYLFHPLVFALALLAAAFLRFGVAQLSAGPDVAQFWGFAEAYRLYGVDFYRYAPAEIDLFPFKYWAYVYPPVWLLILGLALLLVPLSSASDEMANPAWRLAVKTPIILADLGIGVLLYWGIPGSKSRKLLFACLWLFNPAAWYNSAVFGQFDSIAAAFLLASVIVLEKGNDRLAFLLAALAAMTKQHTLLAIAVMTVICIRQMTWRRLAGNLAIIAGIAAALSLPFVLTGNLRAYFKAVLLPGQAPDYQYPLMYAFNAWSSLMTHLHNLYGWETLGLIKATIPILIAAEIGAGILCYIKKLSLLRGALIGMLIFVAVFYRINYQYLVIFIPLALLAASRTPYKSERLVALALAIFPAAWLWLINVASWFVYLSPTGDWIVPWLDRMGLTHQEIPDSAYVAFSAGLMLLCLAYIILSFTRWKEVSDAPETGLPELPSR